eukprot:3635141-Prymnesium_polylepis.1
MSGSLAGSALEAQLEANHRYFVAHLERQGTAIAGAGARWARWLQRGLGAGLVAGTGGKVRKAVRMKILRRSLSRTAARMATAAAAPAAALTTQAGQAAAVASAAATAAVAAGPATLLARVPLARVLLLASVSFGADRLVPILANRTRRLMRKDRRPKAMRATVESRIEHMPP